MRQVYGSDQLVRLLDMLQAPSDPLEPQWARRITSNHERLLRGDLPETAAVVRDLPALDRLVPAGWLPVPLGYPATGPCCRIRMGFPKGSRMAMSVP